MHRFFNLVTRFGRDERGVFAIVFALIAIVLIAFGGATVDYVSLQQARSRAQVALDAAALALQPEIFNAATSKGEILLKAQALMVDRIGSEWGVVASISDIQINLENGALYLKAKLNMPTMFVKLVGVNQLDAEIQSEARRRRLELEVAMVLDNSGSMLTDNRIGKLQEAATCATNTIFYDAVNNNTECTPATGARLLDNVRMAVVPFTMYVNVGPTNSSQPWIDGTGVSLIANDNFDNDGNSNTDFNANVNRLALYDDITNDNWRGCVEARPHFSTGGTNQYLDTDDTPPVAGSDRTLFVPLFAPDVADKVGSSYTSYTADSPTSCDRPTNPLTSCTFTEVKTKCSSYSNCTGTTTNTYAMTGPVNFSVNSRYYVGGYPPACSCRAWSTDTGTGVYTGSNSNRTYTRVRTCLTTYIPAGLSDREYQERMCKYQGSIDNTTGQKGPNADCPYGSVTPLTATPSIVKSSISAMVADGGTNIHEGTAWGLRVLSPTAPFTEGLPYGEGTSKVMIVMTDGENTAYTAGNMNGSNYFSVYGYPYNSENTTTNSSSRGNVPRLGNISTTEAGVETEMNNRTLQTCANAKALGITIYTIGLSTDKTSAPAVVKNMLTQCASSASNAFFPTQASELRTVFQQIAQQLTALRLTQ